MQKRCPKCGYIRGKDEIYPEYECPKCGIVYAKYEALSKRKEKKIIKQPDNSSFQGIKIQTLIIFITGLVFIIMIAFPPFYFVTAKATYNAGYAFIFSPPGHAIVNSSMLLVQIIVAAISGSIFYLLFKDSQKRLWVKKAKERNVNKRIGSNISKPLPLLSTTSNIDQSDTFLGNAYHPWRRFFCKNGRHDYFRLFSEHVSHRHINIFLTSTH